MSVDIQFHEREEPEARYVSMAPSPCRIRQIGGNQSIQVELSCRQAQANGGMIVFYPSPTVDPPNMQLTLTVPGDGSWVDFWVGGRWGFPSAEDRDCVLIARSEGTTLAEVPLMVRVRKNANSLLPGERDRFLWAFAKLNNAGTGRFQAFRDIHQDSADAEEHRGPQFLPWHRAYLLDLERELQAIDPTVSLHYWRFDQPAPAVFRSNFMGATQQTSGSGATLVSLDPGHALSSWITDDQPGIRRSARFNPQTSAAPGQPPGFPLRNQIDTLDLGNAYPNFRNLESSPHGAAHVSFNGWISSIQTAAKDPLFFMLHSNVDRLWALWQWYFDRNRPDDAASYTGEEVDGRRLDDTLWPWNEITVPPRPDFAPRGPIRGNPLTTAPDPQPRLRGMIDYQGHITAADRLGFGYDVVPYQKTAEVEEHTP